MFGLAKDRAPSPHKIEFPFPREAKGLEGAINAAQVKFAGKKVVEAIIALKPYRGGNEILSGLHRLDAQDKHRLLILSRRIPAMRADELGKLGIPMVGAGVILFAGPEEEPLIAIKGGGGFGNRRQRLALASQRGEWKKETKIQPAFHIALGKGLPFEHQAVITTLRKGVDAIEETVSILIEAFLHKDN
jgi:hypothetical protein